MKTKLEESFSGPLPHPEHFKKYNQIVPGAVLGTGSLASLVGVFVHGRKTKVK